MPLGEFEIRLRVVGVFRDAREAASKIKELAEESIERAQAADRHFQQSHQTTDGSIGWSPSAHQVRRITNEM